MKRGVCLLAVSLLLLFPLGLAGQSSSSKVTSVEKVAEGVWLAQTEQGSNAGWFVAGDEVVVVDSGSDAATGTALLEKIRETAGKPVRFVVITHAHGDHAGGIGPFLTAGAQVICHESAMPAIAPLVEAVSRTKLALITLSDRLAFFSGRRRAVVYFLGPAHTAGDLVLFLPEDRVLFSGDVALGKRVPYMRSPDVNPKGWEKALGNLAQLDIDKIAPGHGALATRQALADTFTYVKKVNELAQLMLRDKVPEDLIEARLHQPDSGLEAAAITPDLIANIQAVVRTEKAAAAPKTFPAAPKPTATPTTKKK